MRRSDCSEGSWPAVTHPDTLTDLTFVNFTTAARDRVLAILNRCTHLRKLRVTAGYERDPCPELLRAVAAMGDGLEELRLNGVSEWRGVVWMCLTQWLMWDAGCATAEGLECVPRSLRVLDLSCKWVCVCDVREMVVVDSLHKATMVSMPRRL